MTMTKGLYEYAVAARHVLNVGGRHTTFSYFRPLAVFSLAKLAQYTKYIHLLSLHIHEYNKSWM